MDHAFCNESNTEVGDLFENMEVGPAFKEKASSTFDLIAGATPMTFAQLTKDSDFLFYTGLDGSKMFQYVFDYVKNKDTVMTYWDGSKKTSKEGKRPASLISSSDNEINEEIFLFRKPGPARKLTLEQAFLLVMMKLTLGLLRKDLAFQFGVSPGKVSQTVITWVKFLSAELSP